MTAPTVRCRLCAREELAVDLSQTGRNRESIPHYNLDVVPNARSFESDGYALHIPHVSPRRIRGRPPNQPRPVRRRAWSRRHDQPGKPVMSTPITLTQLQRLRAGGAQIVEVLPEDEYRWAHVPGALNIPLKELDPSSTARLDRTRDIVVYCHDGL